MEAEMFEGEVQLAPHIVTHPKRRGGKPTVEGTGITVDHIAYWYIEQGLSPRRIVEEYPLTHAQIHAALAYYYDHEEEILERRRKDEEFVENYRRTAPSTVDLRSRV